MITRRGILAPVPRIAAGAAAAVLAAGCSAPRAPAASKAPLPAGAPVVNVDMREFAFSFPPASIGPGRVLFRAHNTGQLAHELRIFPLTDDFPPINDQLHGSERRALRDLGATNVVAPGQDGAFVVDLAPNRRYALICFLRERDGTQHALAGMNAEFRTPAP